MSADLPAAAAIPPDVLELCGRLRAAGHEAYLVGGGVRDLLLGRPPSDFDVATDAHPERVMELFGAAFAIPTGLEHGTVTVLAGAPGAHRPVEVTTFRGEGAYLDGRRPSSVRFGASLDDDLARRDFTMNAIAWDPLAGRLVDPWDGRGDLGRRLIRAVRDPVERFTEDGLRALRAVRQAAQLDFTIEPATLAAIPATLASFRKVSLERVRDELWKLLRAPVPSRGIGLMRHTGMLADVVPELLALAQESYEHTLRAVDEAPRDPVLRLSALLHALGADAADAIARRLRLSNADRAAVVGFVSDQFFHLDPSATDGDVRRFVRRIGVARLEPLFTLREAIVAGRGAGVDRTSETRALRERIARAVPPGTPLEVSQLALSGKDVMNELGIPGSRRVGRILDALLERVLDDPAENDRAVLTRLLPEIAARIS